MPANIMLPTNAKMTAFVCSGRRRPKVRYGAQVRLPERELQRDDDADQHPDDAPDDGRDDEPARDRVVVDDAARLDLRAVGRGRGDVGGGCGGRGVHRFFSLSSSRGRRARRSAWSKSRWRHVKREEEERADDEHQAHEDLEDQDVHRRAPWGERRRRSTATVVRELTGMRTAQSSGDISPARARPTVIAL